MPFRKKSLADLEEDVIKEPITEEEEELMSEKRIERKARHTGDMVEELRAKLARTKLRSDEEIWREIQKKESVKESTVTESPSQSPVSEITSEVKPNINPIVFNSDVASAGIENRVHFDQNSDESDSTDDGSIAPPLEIKFSFSDIEPKPYFSTNNGYLTPWDIDNNYKCRKAKKRTSILKKTDSGTRLKIFRF